MKLKQKIVMLGIGMLVLCPAFAQAELVRATQLNGDMWQKLRNGEINELIVEFRQGDTLPVTMNVGGDLLGTKDNRPSSVLVKRGFFIKFEQDHLWMSLNGADYKSFSDFVRGNIFVGASADQSGGPANAIDVLMQAFLK